MMGGREGGREGKERKERNKGEDVDTYTHTSHKGDFML